MQNLVLKKAKGLLDIRFETLGEIKYAGQYGEDRIEEPIKQQNGKGARTKITMLMMKVI